MAKQFFELAIRWGARRDALYRAGFAGRGQFLAGARREVGPIEKRGDGPYPAFVGEAIRLAANA